MAALVALPLSVRASALPFTIFSAASPPSVSASAVASAICSAGFLAMVGNPSKTRSATLLRSRWQHSDTSNASCLINRLPGRSAPTTRIAREELNAACRLLRALDDAYGERGRWHVTGRRLGPRAPGGGAPGRHLPRQARPPNAS